jgi:hypothetical protein
MINTYLKPYEATSQLAIINPMNRPAYRDERTTPKTEMFTFNKCCISGRREERDADMIPERKKKTKMNQRFFFRCNNDPSSTIRQK